MRANNFIGYQPAYAKSILAAATSDDDYLKIVRRKFILLDQYASVEVYSQTRRREFLIILPGLN
ncbi:MAG TPA: hypothetical protein VJZ26_02820 [Blastocatellia bacterium]|nr:hypothetical protein [Blastocatellia bacterium]